jgi:endonuclease/exonuclease/phosphatase family metal-dependent hydrolase
MPDVIALQEWGSGTPTENFLWQRDWQVNMSHYTLLVASRYPIRGTKSLKPPSMGYNGNIAVYELGLPGGAVPFVNAHLKTPREGLEALLGGKWRGAGDMKRNIEERRHDSRLAFAEVNALPGSPVVAGDFNLPCDSRIFRETWGRYTDSFEAAGWGWGWTKHTKWFGVRIDHIIAGPGWRVLSCRVGPDVGSDHRPVVADLEWTGVTD